MRRAVLALSLACGTSSPSGPDGAVTNDSSIDTGMPIDGAVDQAPPGPMYVGKCGEAMPMGATPAADPPAYMGTCPTFADPPALTTIVSKGAMRRFLVFKPKNITMGEKLPVGFVWHYLGSDPLGMAAKTDAANASDQYKIILIIPEAKGDVFFKWPFEASQSQARIDEELAFFDDMLACVASTFSIDKNCVSSMGVSAGALFTDQLAHYRSERLSSFVSLSGGTGGSLVRPWAAATHRLPAFVLWGGAKDLFPDQFPVLYFEMLSKNLEDGLAKDGHFIEECIHNCGHAVPPFASMPPLDPVWRFMLDHAFWSSPGQSPYLKEGIPKSSPEWCAIGKGNAMGRSPDAGCP